MSLFAYDLTTSPALLLKCSAQTGRIGLFHNEHMFQERHLLSEWQIGQVQQPERPFGNWNVALRRSGGCSAQFEFSVPNNCDCS